MAEDPEEENPWDVFDVHLTVTEDIVYPSVEDLINIHDVIVEDDPNAEPGIRNRGQLDYILDHIRVGSFGELPETVHEKAFQLMRLIAANHPFVDGNKRTALGAANTFYFWNRYDFEYQEEVEAMLILLSVREDLIQPDAAVDYLESIAFEWNEERTREAVGQMLIDVRSNLDELIDDIPESEVNELLDEARENIDSALDNIDPDEST